MKSLIIDTILCIIIVVLVIAIGLFIYYLPVLDRLANPCKYYPNAFIDCVTNN